MPAPPASWMTTLTISPLLIMRVILLLFVLLHCVMDELSMLLLTIPVLFPAVMHMDLWGPGAEDKAIGFDILVLVVVGFGSVRPPGPSPRSLARSHAPVGAGLRSLRALSDATMLRQRCFCCPKELEPL